MKLEELLKGTGGFVLKVGLTATVLTGALIGTRYLNVYYKTKAQEEIRKCIEKENYLLNEDTYRKMFKKCWVLT